MLCSRAPGLLFRLHGIGGPVVLEMREAWHPSHCTTWADEFLQVPAQVPSWFHESCGLMLLSIPHLRHKALKLTRIACIAQGKSVFIIVFFKHNYISVCLVVLEARVRNFWSCRLGRTASKSLIGSFVIQYPQGRHESKSLCSGEHSLSRLYLACVSSVKNEQVLVSRSPDLQFHPSGSQGSLHKACLFRLCVG